MQPTDVDIDLARIEAAARTIDPVFLNSPQYVDEQLSAVLGRRVVVKVETTNPIRSFKGRGTSVLVGSLEPGRPVVCASTGNFGQGIAYAARGRGTAAHVFVPEGTAPVKLERLRSLGAEVTVAGADGAAAKDAARTYADQHPACAFVEDGKGPETAEGAGTIGMELASVQGIDTVVLPVGDAALITGMARWLRRQTPDLRVVGVCATGAAAMVESWRRGHPVSGRADTIAEGIAIGEPIPEAFQRLRALVDDLVLVDDDAMLEAMGLTLRTLGILPEPAGAAGIAAIMTRDLPGDQLATVITGANTHLDLLPRLLPT